jgi:hypothetical protein
MLRFLAIGFRKRSDLPKELSQRRPPRPETLGNMRHYKAAASVSVSIPFLQRIFKPMSSKNGKGIITRPEDKSRIYPVGIPPHLVMAVAPFRSAPPSAPPPRIFTSLTSIRSNFSIIGTYCADFPSMLTSTNFRRKTSADMKSHLPNLI